MVTAAIVTEVRLMQLENEYAPILVTEKGIKIAERLEY